MNVWSSARRTELSIPTTAAVDDLTVLRTRRSHDQGRACLPSRSKQREQQERHVAKGCKGSVKVRDVVHTAAYTVKSSRQRLLGTDSCDASCPPTMKFNEQEQGTATIHVRYRVANRPDDI